MHISTHTEMKCKNVGMPMLPWGVWECCNASLPSQGMPLWGNAHTTLANISLTPRFTFSTTLSTRSRSLVSWSSAALAQSSPIVITRQSSVSSVTLSTTRYPHSSSSSCGSLVLYHSVRFAFPLLSSFTYFWDLNTTFHADSSVRRITTTSE